MAKKKIDFSFITDAVTSFSGLFTSRKGYIAGGFSGLIMTLPVEGWIKAVCIVTLGIAWKVCLTWEDISKMKYQKGK